MTYLFRVISFLLVASILIATNAAAQAGGVVVIQSEVVYRQSVYGQSLIAALTKERQSLDEENLAILRELETEERMLTEARETMSSDDFAIAAEEFDQKVQRSRETQLSKIRAADLKRSKQINIFFKRVAPIVQSVLVEYGAAIVFEKRNALGSLDSADITNIVIKKVDIAFLEIDVAPDGE
jgi:Skp family chaperone for outer membrane proteins